MAGGGGGAWKVAYADLVTAMMAMFLVLWILSQDETVKGDVQLYFKTRFSTLTQQSPGIIPNDAMQLVQSKKDIFNLASVVPLDQVRRLNDDLIKVFVQNPNDMDIKTMEIQMESEGLLINILNNPDKPIFKEGSAAELTAYGQVVFNNIAWTIARFDDTLVEVEGHTSTTYAGDAGEKWDASTARAHKAREVLMGKGVEESQVIKVAGYADKRPLPKRPVTAAQNNRVSIRVRAGAAPGEDSGG
jgi:chemotaxis protein MotB